MNFLLFSFYFTHCFVNYLRINLADKMSLLLYWVTYDLFIILYSNINNEELRRCSKSMQFCIHFSNSLNNKQGIRYNICVRYGNSCQGHSKNNRFLFYILISFDLVGDIFTKAYHKERKTCIFVYTNSVLCLVFMLFC